MTIINQTKWPLDVGKLENHAKKIAFVVGNHCLPAKTKDLDVRLAFLPREEMKKLKKTYKIDEEESDVLSFCEEKDHESLLGELEKNEPVWGSGDIAICPDVVQKNAQKDNITLGYALLEVILHGMWHLCGLNHDYQEKTLQKLQQQQKKWLIKALYRDAKHSPEDFLPKNSSIFR